MKSVTRYSLLLVAGILFSLLSVGVWFPSPVKGQGINFGVVGVTCGTIATNGACANSVGTFHVVSGIATLASNASTITGMFPAFTSSTSYFCVANDITTRANPVQAVPASGSTVTFTNTTGASDNIQFICAGN